MRGHFRKKVEAEAAGETVRSDLDSDANCPTSFWQLAFDCGLSGIGCVKHPPDVLQDPIGFGRRTQSPRRAREQLDFEMIFEGNQMCLLTVDCEIRIWRPYGRECCATPSFGRRQRKPRFDRSYLFQSE